MNPLTPAQWHRAEQIFLEALEIPSPERLSWVVAQCGHDPGIREQVEALLASDPGAPEHLAGVISAAAQSLPDEPASEAGRRVGPYVLVREIGRGGMGTVYHAVRADGEFFQAVAIKLIRRGMDSRGLLQRFRQERQMLASLDHPNIARLLDGGSTPDGQPYLVMDFVEGLPITQYCRNQKLTTRQKLELFLDVCEGVQHAHEGHIIHRDLKPANILVARNGRPKLLDFGIAKWVDPAVAPETMAETITGFRLLTPEYASPEQVRGGPITESSDIYALGAILFELLTEEKACQLQAATPAEIERVVCDTATRRPSEAVAARSLEGATQLRRELAGDLDTIVLTAMRKEPERRYASVAELAADLGRYLDGRPIEARQESAAYRFFRKIRRHRLVFAVALAAVAVSVAGMLAWLRWQQQQAPERLSAIAVLPFVNLGTEAQQDALSDGLTEDIITELSQIPTLRVPSRTSVWQYRGKSFDVRQAGKSLGVGAVLEGSVRRAGQDIRVVAQLISMRDGFHLWAQNYDRKQADMLSIQKDVSRAIAADIRARLERNGLWNHTGRAEPDSEAAKDYLRGYQLFNMNEIRAEWKEGTPRRLQNAIDAFDSATKKDPQFAAAWASLAEASEWAGGFDERRRASLSARAKEAARRALQLEPTNALALTTLGNLYFDYEWDLRQADSYLRRAVEISPRSTGVQADYANLLIVRGRIAEAQELLERTQMLEPTSARPSGRLAFLYANLGQCDAADRAAAQSLALDSTYRHALWASAYCEEQRGKLVAAEEQYRRILALYPGEHRTLASLGCVLAATNRRQEAEAIAADLESTIRRGRRREVFAAFVRTALGQADPALSLLEQGFRLRDPNLLNLPLEPRLRPLASSPRFQSLLSRIAALR